MQITEQDIKEDVQKGLKKVGFERGTEWHTEGGKFKIITSAQYGGVVGLMPWDEILPFFEVGKIVKKEGWVPFKVEAVSTLTYQTAVQLRT